MINAQLAGFSLVPLTTTGDPDGLSVQHLVGVSPPPARSGPLVSVIVPACDCQDFLNPTVQSLRDQSYANIEIIVVDDGSRHGTALVA